MLIDADSNTKTGYHGADYDFYIEAIGGKWSTYLYQLSSTGGYRLIESKANYTNTFGGSTIGTGYVNLQLDLGTINYPSTYNVMFYAAESFKSNEDRDFTSWVSIPPPTLKIATSPNDIIVRQGEEQLVPAKIVSSSGVSNDVLNITRESEDANNNNNNNDPENASSTTFFNADGPQVSIERVQPPLFKIDIPMQTSLGIYTIPLSATIREPSVAALTKPLATNNTISGRIDPEFQLSKVYPTVGYLTRPVNLTITVLPPRNVNDQFKDFWSIYGQPISIVVGGFAGGFASLIFSRIKSRSESK
jgi:hypothetical protein